MILLFTGTSSSVRINCTALVLLAHPFTIGNPVNHFPIYQPSEDRVAEIAKAYAEENNPLGVHYDASKEVRAKGAGFYQFSADEETRRAQLEELKASREETERTRQQLGAEDVRPGEVEGMRDGDGAGSGKSRAMEKRKRELEERRKLVEAKRRKLKQGDATPTIPADSEPTEPTIKIPHETSIEPATSMSTSVEIHSVRNTGTTKAVDVPSDPFAALEAQSTTVTQKQVKNKTKPASDEADDFLAQLEHEFLGSRNKKPS